jgi:hypothetical protein
MQRIWSAIKAAFEAEATWPELAATAEIDRAIGWDQISEQVWSEIRDIYLDCYPWVTGFYQEGGQTFVVISHEGKLYKHPITITDNEASVGPSEPVTIDFPAVAGGAPEDEMTRSSITIHRQADGRIRGIGIVATSVLNRVGEIDSRALFDSFVDHWEESGANPILEFYHLGETSRLGEIDYLARADNVYINSWLFDDTSAGRAAADSLERESDYWGFSIGYLPTCDPEMITVTKGVTIPVYTRGIQRETSIVAEKRAANLFTMPVTGVERMNKDIKADLLKLMGGDEALTNEAEALIDTRNRAIDEQGLVTRSDADTDTEQPVEPEVELDDAALAAIARTVENGEQFAALVGNVASLTETVASLTATVSAVAQANEASNVETQRRLKALEADEETKRREWIEDQPTRQTLRVTHRPRNGGEQPQADEPQGDESETMADIAKRNLAAKIPQRY